MSIINASCGKEFIMCVIIPGWKICCTMTEGEVGCMKISSIMFPSLKAGNLCPSSHTLEKVVREDPDPLGGANIKA